MNDKTNETIKSELEQGLETASPEQVSSMLAAKVVQEIQELAKKD